MSGLFGEGDEVFVAFPVAEDGLGLAAVPGGVVAGAVEAIGDAFQDKRIAVEPGLRGGGDEAVVDEPGELVEDVLEGVRVDADGGLRGVLEAGGLGKDVEEAAAKVRDGGLEALAAGGEAGLERGGVGGEVLGEASFPQGAVEAVAAEALEGEAGVFGEAFDVGGWGWDGLEGFGLGAQEGAQAVEAFFAAGDDGEGGVGDGVGLRLWGGVLCEEVEEGPEVPPLPEDLAALLDAEVHAQVWGQPVFGPRGLVDADAAFVAEDPEEGLAEGAGEGFGEAGDEFGKGPEEEEDGESEEGHSDDEGGEAPIGHEVPSPHGEAP